MVDRSKRRFMTTGLALGGLSVLSSALPHFAFARTPQNKRLIVILLRGAMDGLAAVAPYADTYYKKARGAFALSDNDEQLKDLDGFFALHQALSPLHALYQQKELLILHAASTPYRKRSHFDAQDLLENGTDKPHGSKSGWLNRTIELLQPVDGMVFGADMPLIMQGDVAVQSWSPSRMPEADEDFYARVMHMYQSDAMLHEHLMQGIETQQLMDDTEKLKGQAMKQVMHMAGQLLSREDGPRIASIDMSGWDTHANQGVLTGRLSRQFSQLAGYIMQLKSGLAEQWNDTAILVLTEFGRTVAPNGTKGTDHGTASTAFLIGGSVEGGRVIGKWPGLEQSKLYEGRDLYPANDIRALCKSVLHSHLGVPRSDIEKVLFPHSESAGFYDGIMHAS